MDKILEAFTFGTLQSVNQVRAKLKANNISWDEFDEWLNAKNVTIGKKVTREPVRRKCPKCGYKLVIIPVNDMPSNQLGGEWQSMWYCDMCSWNELSRLGKRDEELKYVGIKKDDGKPLITRVSRRTQSRIIDPKRVRMLYYNTHKRRMR